MGLRYNSHGISYDYYISCPCGTTIYDRRIAFEMDQYVCCLRVYPNKLKPDAQLYIEVLKRGGIFARMVMFLRCFEVYRVPSANFVTNVVHDIANNSKIPPEKKYDVLRERLTRTEILFSWLGTSNGDQDILKWMTVNIVKVYHKHNIYRFLDFLPAYRKINYLMYQQDVVVSKNTADIPLIEKKKLAVKTLVLTDQVANSNIA